MGEQVREKGGQDLARKGERGRRARFRVKERRAGFRARERGEGSKVRGRERRKMWLRKKTKDERERETGESRT